MEVIYRLKIRITFTNKKSYIVYTDFEKREDCLAAHDALHKGRHGPGLNAVTAVEVGLEKTLEH